MFVCYKFWCKPTLHTDAQWSAHRVPRETIWINKADTNTVDVEIILLVMVVVVVVELMLTMIVMIWDEIAFINNGHETLIDSLYEWQTRSIRVYFGYHNAFYNYHSIAVPHMKHSLLSWQHKKAKQNKS